MSNLFEQAFNEENVEKKEAEHQELKSIAEASTPTYTNDTNSETVGEKQNAYEPPVNTDGLQVSIESADTVSIQNTRGSIQTTLWSFLEEEKPTSVTPNSKTKKLKPTSSTCITKAQKAPVKKEDEFEVNTDTIIRYDGDRRPITDFFSPDELEHGIRSTTGDETEERRKITGEDLRKRMEEEFGELLEEWTTMLFNKERNMVVPTIAARKKGGVCA